MSDVLDLYSRRLLALAADIPHLGRLDAPQGEGRARSPQCGSTVAVTVALDESGRIARFAQEVRACALGQASAALLGAAVHGTEADTLLSARAQLATMLAGGPAPGAPWDALEVLSAARDFPNRHASILLAWDATLDAVAQASGNA